MCLYQIFFELFPEPKSSKDWDNLREELYLNGEKFTKLIEQMSDDKLTDKFVKEEYGTYHRNINAIIEHSYYHLGQISLIKKLLNE